MQIVVLKKTFTYKLEIIFRVGNILMFINNFLLFIFRQKKHMLDVPLDIKINLFTFKDAHDRGGSGPMVRKMLFLI